MDQPRKLVRLKLVCGVFKHACGGPVTMLVPCGLDRNLFTRANPGQGPVCGCCFCFGLCRLTMGNSQGDGLVGMNISCSLAPSICDIWMTRCMASLGYGSLHVRLSGNG